MSYLNPFGYYFAARYLTEDNPDYLKYLAEKETYDKYCFDKNISSCYYCFYSITKKTRRGEWYEENITYEMHYVKYTYYADNDYWLNKENPIFKPIVLNDSNKDVYIITKIGRPEPFISMNTLGNLNSNGV